MLILLCFLLWKICILLWVNFICIIVLLIDSDGIVVGVLVMMIGVGFLGLLFFDFLFKVRI